MYIIYYTRADLPPSVIVILLYCVLVRFSLLVFVYKDTRRRSDNAYHSHIHAPRHFCDTYYIYMYMIHIHRYI